MFCSWAGTAAASNWISPDCDFDHRAAAPSIMQQEDGMQAWMMLAIWPKE
jgi:hypothetical protein